MAAKFVVFVACLALANAKVVKRETNVLEEVQKHAAEFQKTFDEQFQSIANSKNTEQLNKALKDGTDSVLQQLSALSTSFQGAIADANGKAKEVLEQAQANIKKSAEELRKQHPEVEKQASQLKEKLQSAVQNAVAETQKVAKEVASNVEETNAKLAPKIKEAYEGFAKQVSEVQKKIEEASKKQK